MCQARTSVHFSSVLVWTLLSSLTFGFCSIWSLHFVAMLACELDLPIGINIPLTILSSVLAVIFTFAALASDLLWEHHRQGRRRRGRSRNKSESRKASGIAAGSSLLPNGSKPHFGLLEQEEHNSEDEEISERMGLLQDPSDEEGQEPSFRMEGTSESPGSMHEATSGDSTQKMSTLSPAGSIRGTPRPCSNFSASRRSSSYRSTQSSYRLADIMNFAHRSTAPASNAFRATGEALYLGCTPRNIIKAFSWSLAVSGMHYVGIAALQIPEGYYILSPSLVFLSGMISWIVCLVGVILMSQIETHLAQQFLFAVVASTGVAAMHFTGMSFPGFGNIPD